MAGAVLLRGTVQQSLDALYTKAPSPDQGYIVTTHLDKTLKRELTIDGRAFIVAVSPEGIKITLKGRRKGQELRWRDLVSGEAALAVALNASVGKFAEGAGAQRRATPTHAARTNAAPPRAAPTKATRKRKSRGSKTRAR
jgi:hypothetical protein